MALLLPLESVSFKRLGEQVQRTPRWRASILFPSAATLQPQLCATLWCFLAFASGWPAPLAFAHTTSLSYSEIQIQESQVLVRLRLNLYEVGLARQLDRNSDLKISDQEARTGFPLLIRPLLDNYQVKTAAVSGTAHAELVNFSAGTGELECLFTFAFSRRLEEVWFQVTLHNLTDSGHLNLAQLRYDGQQEQRFFNLQNPETKIELRRTWISYLKLSGRYTVLSAKIAFTNHEYLAFLFALLLSNQAGPSLSRTLVAVLIAQVVSFLLGSLDLLSLPLRFVQSAMALGVAYTAVENLVLKDVSSRWLTGSFFGLIFGFSCTAAVKNFGLPKRGFLVSLISFSLGITLAAGAIAMLILWVCRRGQTTTWRGKAVTTASLILVVLGSFWFVRRMF